MSFIPGDETVADGTMAKAIFDAMVDKLGANEALAADRKKGAAAFAIGICEHANPRLADGSVVGPEVATDNAVVRFDGTTGSLIKSGPVVIDDSGNITGVGTVDGRDVSTDGSMLDTHETRLDDAESDIASLDTSLGSHLIDTGNPHAVTAAQIGAVPTSRAIGTTAPLTGGGALSGDLSLGISAATTSARGTMSAEDKTKLDGMRNPARALFTKVGLTKPGTSTATTLLDSDAWTEELDTHGYFTQPSNGRFKYTDATNRKFLVRVTGQVNKTVAADSIRLLLFKSGVDVGTDSSSAVARVPLNDNWASVSFITTVTVALNDILDVRARSGTSANDIKVNVTMELEEVVS